MIDKQKIEAFFEAYQINYKEALTGKIDIKKITGCFAECFLEASPLGINCRKNNEEFERALPKGYEFYRQIGTESMEILSIEITALDEIHSIVKVHWQATYRKKDASKEIIDFDVIYFVQDQDSKLKIFSYITGDEQKVLKEHGLILNSNTSGK